MAPKSKSAKSRAKRRAECRAKQRRAKRRAKRKEVAKLKKISEQALVIAAITLDWIKYLDSEEFAKLNDSVLGLDASNLDCIEYPEFEDDPTISTAFQVESEVQENEEEEGKTLLTASETGIHSIQWAQSIVPQAGFLSLPAKIRNRIFHFLFQLTSNDHTNPAYKRNLSKIIHTVTHWSWTDPSLLSTYLNLSLVCRQLYIDITDSGLLHRLATLCFSCPCTMAKYLSNISPFHKSHIRTIELQVSLVKVELQGGRLPFSVCPTVAVLASLERLDNLKIDFHHRNKTWHKEFRYQFLALVDDETTWIPLGGRLKKCSIVFTDAYMFPPGLVPSAEEHHAVQERIQGWMIRK